MSSVQQATTQIVHTESWCVPRLTARTLLADPASWNLPALSVSIMPQDLAHPVSPDLQSSRLSIGWEERGLAMLVEVRGESWEEHERADRGYEASSVEVYLRDPLQPRRTVQAVISPGVAAGRAGVRTAFFDHRPAADQELGAPSALVASRMTELGYLLELVLPLQSIGQVPAAGLRLDVQVFVNHRRPGRGRMRERWHVHTADGYQPLRFDVAGASARPSVGGAWVSIIAHERLCIQALGGADAVGDEMVVDQQGARLGAARFHAWHGLASARLELPLAVARPTLALSIGRRRSDHRVEALANEHLPDLAPIFCRGMRAHFEHPDHPYRGPEHFPEGLDLVGRYIFRGEEFPRLTLATPGVRAHAGVLSVTTRWIDAEGAVVTRAARPGRYGAEVSVQWANGTTSVAHRTLVRLSDGPAPLEVGSLARQLEAMCAPGGHGAWPPGLGWLHADKSRAGDAWMHDHRAAAALAALIDAPEPSHCRPDFIERRWWHRVRTALGTQVRYPYTTTFPTRYEAQGTTRWPALIYMHGSGDYEPGAPKRGPSLLDQYAAAHLDFPLVVCSPQASDWWDSCALADLVAELIALHRVDPDRIVVSGFSMGGYGTWQAIIDTPELYAAAIPMGGGPGQAWEAERARHVPVWCINGGGDEVTTCAQARTMVDALNAAGGAARLTIQPALDHLQSMHQSPHVPGLWAWAAAQRRHATPG